MALEYRLSVILTISIEIIRRLRNWSRMEELCAYSPGASGPVLPGGP